MSFVVNNVLTGSFVTFFTDVKKQLLSLEARGSVAGETPA